MALTSVAALYVLLRLSWWHNGLDGCEYMRLETIYLVWHLLIYASYTFCGGFAKLLGVGWGCPTVTIEFPSRVREWEVEAFHWPIASLSGTDNEPSLNPSLQIERCRGARRM
ncbi:hypothetical protein F4803DRAFT_526173, partial [Xylaria telfairii]